jgi:hypothetical protein
VVGPNVRSDFVRGEGLRSIDGAIPLTQPNVRLTPVMPSPTRGEGDAMTGDKNKGPKKET